MTKSQQQEQANSYGYVPFTMPNKQQRDPVEQDIDPVGAANDVLQKLNALEIQPRYP